MEFFEFTSVEAAFDAMRKAEVEANKRVTPDQQAIGYGDYFIRLWDTGIEGVLRIYGRIMTRDELMKSEKDAGAPDEELVWTMETMDGSYRRGYRFGWCYSVVEPEGELGSTHVSTMVKKITREEFEAAKQRGWQ